MGGSSPLSRTGPECMPHRLVYYQSPSHMDCGASASSRSSYFLYSMTSLWKRGLFFMRAKSCFKPRRPDRTSVVNRLDALHTNNEGADGIHQLVYGVSFETWNLQLPFWFAVHFSYNLQYHQRCSSRAQSEVPGVPNRSSSPDNTSSVSALTRRT